MKCLTVRQPFAALIVAGLKIIECRRWPTPYRSRLLIHAGKGTLPLNPEFSSLLGEVPKLLLAAYGMVIGIVTIKECRRLRPSDRLAALFEPDPTVYAWILEAAEEVTPFFLVQGQQRLFDVPWPPVRTVGEAAPAFENVLHIPPATNRQLR